MAVITAINEEEQLRLSADDVITGSQESVVRLPLGIKPLNLGVILALLSTAPALGQNGTLVDIGTHTLNIVCTGAADTRRVVILEAGAGGSSAAWKGVRAALPTTVRACAYDRAGLGKSAAGPEPSTMDPEVTELHTLLERSNINRPIVFVGSSLWAILARLYFAKYPDSVAGVIFLDPTDENDIVFNTKVNRWIRVSELQDPPVDGALRFVIGAGKRAQPPGTSIEQWSNA